MTTTTDLTEKIAEVLGTINSFDPSNIMAGNRDRVAKALAGEIEVPMIIDNAPANERWIIFQPIGSRMGVPCIVRTPLFDDRDEVLTLLNAVNWRDGYHNRCSSTVDVATWFRNQAGDGLIVPDDATDVMAPANVYGGDLMPLGGNIGSFATLGVGRFPMDRFEWFDLDALPYGNVIYRITADLQAWIFRKHLRDEWHITVVPRLEWPKNRYGDSIGPALNRLAA